MTDHFDELFKKASASPVRETSPRIDSQSISSLGTPSAADGQSIAGQEGLDISLEVLLPSAWPGPQSDGGRAAPPSTPARQAGETITDHEQRLMEERLRMEELRDQELAAEFARFESARSPTRASPEGRASDGVQRSFDVLGGQAQDHGDAADTAAMFARELQASQEFQVESERMDRELADSRRKAKEKEQVEMSVSVERVQAQETQQSQKTNKEIEEEQRQERENLQREQEEHARIEAALREADRKEAERREQERIEREEREKRERQDEERKRLEKETEERERKERGEREERDRKQREEAERKEREKREVEEANRQRFEQLEREKMLAEEAEKRRIQMQKEREEREEAERALKEMKEKERERRDREEGERREAARKEEEKVRKGKEADEEKKRKEQQAVEAQIEKDSKAARMRTSEVNCRSDGSPTVGSPSRKTNGAVTWISDIVTPVSSPLAAVKHKQSGPVDNNESLAAPARRSLQSTYVGLGVGSTEAIQSKIDRKESTSTDSGFEDAVDFPTPHSYDDLSATVRQLCDMVESDGKTVGALSKRVDRLEAAARKLLERNAFLESRMTSLCGAVLFIVIAAASGTALYMKNKAKS